MAFKDASAFGFTITLPFGQRSYTINSPDVEVGHALVSTTVAAGTAYDIAEKLSELSEEDAEYDRLRQRLDELTNDLTIPDSVSGDYFKSILGPAYDEMVANHEPYELVKLAASTVSVWVISGRDAAEAFWNNGGRPPRPRRTPQDRRRRTATSK